MNQAGEGLTAGLEKGLRMFSGGTDLSEEGMGFGVPVIVRSHRTYLSFTARGINSGKTYMMDAIQVVGGKKVLGKLPYLWLETKGRVYKAFPRAQKFLLMMQATANLTPSITFESCDSISEIPVTYLRETGSALITVDLSGLQALSGDAKVYILNEQGGRAFPYYWERGAGSREQKTTDEAIGWGKVMNTEAGFESPDRIQRFSLRQLRGADMFRGREVAADVLSWSGVDYDVTGLIGTKFSYRVKTTGGRLEI